MIHGTISEDALSPHARKGREGKGSGKEAIQSCTHSQLVGAHRRPNAAEHDDHRMRAR